jgi:L-seryl-tRNA(Ser) seleniumtransferase
LDTVSKEIAKLPGVSTSFFTPDLANHVPHMQITWDAKISLTAPQATQILRNGSPPIAVGGGEGRPGLAISSFMLQPGEERIVADQLVKLFRDHAG